VAPYVEGPHRHRAVLLGFIALLSVGALALTAAPSALALGPPIISETSVSNLTDTSATFQATLNPNAKKTTYYFQYITRSAWQQDGEQFGAEDTLTTPAVMIEKELSATHPVSGTAPGLSPSTAYRFRLFAESSKAPEGVTGEEIDFTTYGASQGFAGACPQNESFRTGPSLRLPDCRAYEQASPRQKNGSDVTGTLFSVEASLSGDAITSYVKPGMPGGSGFQFEASFISRRVGTAWSTAGLLPPASYGNAARVISWTPDLALSFSSAGFSPESAKRVLLARQSSDGSLTPLAPYSLSGGYAFVAASADDSEIFFESTAALTSGALSGKRNLYRYDRVSGETTLVDVLPASEGGAAAPSGAVAGPYAWWEGSTTEGGAADEYLTQEDRAVSADGKTAYFTELGTGRLYVRQGLDSSEPQTLQVNSTEKTNGAAGGADPHGPAPAAFQIASADGKTAYFTSSEKLTNDANTGPEVEGPKIGRAKLGGAIEPEEVLPELLPEGALGTATDGEYLYWASPRGTIGRAKIGASGLSDLNPAFIQPGETCFETHFEIEPGVSHCAPSTPRYVVVHGEYVYWTNTGPLGGDAFGAKQELPLKGAGTIGRAKLDGSGDLVPSSIEPEFIAGASNPEGIAADSEHIYWANSLEQICTGGVCFPNQLSIARAGLEGDAVEESFREKASGSNADWLGSPPRGLAIVGGYMYWAGSDNSKYGVIYKAPLDEMIEHPEQIVVGQGSEPRGVAVAGSRLYWAAQGYEAIGRVPVAAFETQGHSCSELPECDAEFIEFSGGPIGLTVDPAEEHLYWSLNGETPPNPGNDLYRFEAEAPEGERLTDLTAETADEDGAEVAGVLGASEDGSHLYFAANGVLAANEGALGSHASYGDCAHAKGDNWTGTCNLYLYHGGEVTYVAQLKASADALDWAPQGGGNTGGSRQPEARISADGETLLFSSVLPQTPYGNHGIGELYRYEAASGQIDCVSCSPTGLPPSSAPELKQGDQDHTGSSHSTFDAQPFLSRNLSADGKRVFFQSAEKLVAADVNGEAGCPHDVALGAGLVCTDVYEWEAPGEASCTEASSAYVPADGGCVYLLSSGTSTFPSYLGDVSADGEVAFIFTRDQLVPSDEDDLQDIYAVTVDGGLASQHTATPPPCGSAAECRGKGTSATAQSGAGSASFSGPGNKEQPHLRDCDPAAERAQKLALRSKQLRRQAKHAQSPGEARRLLRESAQLGKRAHSLSGDAKRCRNANRKASR
jgi:hypothetical protein